LITSEASIETAAAAAKQASLSSDNVFLFDDGYATFENRGKAQAGFRHWTHLIAPEKIGQNFKWDELNTEEIKNTTVTLNYSSGTTGVPKGKSHTTFYTKAEVKINCIKRGGNHTL